MATRHAPKILCFAGSNRKGSINGKLAACAARELGKRGASANVISLADYPMPIFDEDLEAAEGVPQSARALKALISEHHGVFIASPEYNTSLTPLLKNTFDWLSRLGGGDEPPAAAFKNRAFAVGAATDGALGGIRGLMQLRTVLEVGLGALVIPEMASVPGASSNFDAEGHLTDPRTVMLFAMAMDRLYAESVRYA